MITSCTEAGNFPLGGREKRKTLVPSIFFLSHRKRMLNLPYLPQKEVSEQWGEHLALRGRSPSASETSTTTRRSQCCEFFTPALACFNARPDYESQQ